MLDIMSPTKIKESETVVDCKTMPTAIWNPVLSVPVYAQRAGSDSMLTVTIATDNDDV